jgi:transcriptional regulator EpsA
MSANFEGTRKEKGDAILAKLNANHGVERAQGTGAHQGSLAAGKDSRVVSIGPKGCGLAQAAFEMTADESQRFLRIIWNASRIRHHYELFLLLQGEIQHFISHQILLAAWGDFQDSKLTLDVVSALPGVRTGAVNGCGPEVQRMLKDLHARWVANGRRKMLLNNGRVKAITSSLCDCALHKSMRKMQSIIVHGVRDERDQTDSIYVALDPDSAISGRSVERFFTLVDPLIVQIDVAFQRVGALKPVGITEEAEDAWFPGQMSAREREIMKWVTEGRTNAEIGAILGISPFTVKNHVQRIFKKLGAANRTEAVSKCNRYGSGQ